MRRLIVIPLVLSVCALFAALVVLMATEKPEAAAAPDYRVASTGGIEYEAMLGRPVDPKNAVDRRIVKGLSAGDRRSRGGTLLFGAFFSVTNATSRARRTADRIELRDEDERVYQPDALPASRTRTPTTRTSSVREPATPASAARPTPTSPRRAWCWCSGSQVRPRQRPRAGHPQPAPPRPAPCPSRPEGTAWRRGHAGGRPPQRRRGVRAQGPAAERRLGVSARAPRAPADVGARVTWRPTTARPRAASIQHEGHGTATHKRRRRGPPPRCSRGTRPRGPRAASSSWERSRRRPRHA